METRPCPRCRQALQIPRPLPEKVSCGNCGASISLRPAQGVSPSAPAVAPDSFSTTPPRQESLPNYAHSSEADFLSAGPARTRASLVGRVALVFALIFALGGTLFWAYATFLKGSGKEEIAVKKEEGEIIEDSLDLKPTFERENEEKIRVAIERGAAHLKKRLLGKDPIYPTHGADNRFGDQAVVGATALAGLALLEAGTPLSDPALQHVLSVVRARGKALTIVYALGATLFFLNRLGDAGELSDADRDLHRSLTLRLVNGQLADGRWTYTNGPLTLDKEKALLLRLEKSDFKPDAVGGPPSASMTQFAMMSLWGSRRHGIPVRQSFLHASARFQTLQHPDGSWSYVEGREILHESNTCAGLMALAMEKVIRTDPIHAGKKNPIDPPLNSKVNEMRDKAIARLAKAVGRPKDHKSPIEPSHVGNIFRADAWGDIYFLWCLERVAVIYGWETIEGKDWYRWGSDILLANQKSDGSWIDRHGDIPDTCFAILFLRRANLAQDLTEQLRRALK